MPEGDTVWRTAQRLDAALCGQVLITVDLRWPSVATVRLAGATTVEVVSRGKHLLHRLDTGVSIHSHLRMEGQWRVEATSDVTARQLADPQLRAVVATSTWTALGLRLGMLDVVATGDEHQLVGHLGPDLLGPDWDLDEAVRRLTASDATIGAALLDQTNLAGIGTLYASESLFLERTSPWTVAGRMDPSAVRSLVQRAHRLLDTNRRHAVQSTTGERTRGRTSWVHGRSGQPCRRCSEPVRVSEVGVPPRQRPMFYCPACQEGPTPTDGAATAAPSGSAAARGPARGFRESPRGRRSGGRSGSPPGDPGEAGVDPRRGVKYL